MDQHQGFVNGPCWDPVGEFLDMGSDDRSVRIWRNTDWELEVEVNSRLIISLGHSSGDSGKDT